MILLNILPFLEQKNKVKEKLDEKSRVRKRINFSNSSSEECK